MKNFVRTFLLLVIAVNCSISYCSAEKATALAQVPEFTSAENQDVFGIIKFWELPDRGVFRAEFLLGNNTDTPIDFKKARYLAWGEDKTKYYMLSFDRVRLNDREKRITLLDPDGTIQIFCNIPVDPGDILLSEILIELSDGRSFTFIPKEQLIKEPVNPLACRGIKILKGSVCARPSEACT